MKCPMCDQEEVRLVGDIIMSSDFLERGIDWSLYKINGFVCLVQCARCYTTLYTKDEGWKDNSLLLKYMYWDKIEQKIKERSAPTKSLPVNVNTLKLNPALLEKLVKALGDQKKNG